MLIITLRMEWGTHYLGENTWVLIMFKTPIAVVISDIHFNLNNLELASKALHMALHESHKRQIPTVIAGDLHDTKAIIRAEVANRLLLLLKQATMPVYILVGNHDLVNEKGKEHGLNYLEDKHIYIIDRSTHGFGIPVHFISYQSSPEEFLRCAKNVKSGPIICHQGFSGAFMGDYVQDKSSIDPSVVSAHRVISGHYHKHQTVGTVTYIGSPYTQSFGEANDPAKGFLVLYSDGSYERVLTNLRKHVVVELKVKDEENQLYIGIDDNTNEINSDDLLWVKARGPKSLLDRLSKEHVGKALIGHSNFKLDLIPNEYEELEVPVLKEVTNEELFDTIIDDSGDTDEQKVYLKRLWREITQS